jgi:hypothetical protein
MYTSFTDWESGVYLEHYGVPGMKWGMRRYQNADGSLTAAGQKRYEKTGVKGYQYKSHATKKYERKAKRAKVRAEIYRDSIKELKGMHDWTDMYEKSDNHFIKKWGEKAKKKDAKAALYTQRAKRSAEIDRGEQEYAKNLSTGKAILGTLLAGGNSMKGYAQYRSMAKQTGNNITGKKLLSAVKAYNAGAYGSRARKAAYIRQDEGKNGLGQKLYRVESKIEDAAGRMIPEQERRKKKNRG